MQVKQKLNNKKCNTQQQLQFKPSKTKPQLHATRENINNNSISKANKSRLHQGNKKTHR